MLINTFKIRLEIIKTVKKSEAERYRVRGGRRYSVSVQCRPCKGTLNIDMRISEGRELKQREE